MKNISTLLALAVVTAASMAAHAQGPILEEVIVTAQKRSQSANDIGMAISAFTGERLQALGIATPEDLALQTPGLSVGDGGGLGVPIYTIRGVGFDSININASSTVGVYIDEVASPYPIMTTGQLFDVDRVEVLKGPQGDLYGRNTTGGAISFLSRQPTDDFDAGITLDYGSYGFTRIEGFVSGPLSDSLRGRVAALSVTQDGWQDVETLDANYNPVSGGKNGEIDQWSIRGKLIWNPSDKLAIALGAYHTDDQSDETGLKNVGENVGLNYFADDPANPSAIYYLTRQTLQGVVDSTTSGTYLGIPIDPSAPILPMTATADIDSLETIYLSTNPTRDQSAKGFSLKIDADFTGFSLTSITAYDSFDRERTIDWDASWLVIADNFSDAEIDSFSQEIRLTSTSKGNLNWIVGAYYSDDTVKEDYTTYALDSAIAGFDVSTGYEQDTETVALFAHTEWQFTEQLKATLGIRYTDEERSVSNLGTVLANDPYGIWGGLPNGYVLTDLGGPLYNGAVDTQNVTGRIVVDYTPNDGTLIYASISNGFKSGGFNAENAITSEQYEPYDKEEVIAYEAGFKLTLLENTMNLNGAAFLYDYTDKQTVDFIPTIFGPLGIIANADKSKISGLELDLRWAPLEGLDISAGVSFLDSEVEKYNGFFGSRAGFELPNTPEWSYNAVISYEIPLSQGYSVRMLADYAWTDATRSALENADYFETDSYGVLGSRIALIPTNGLWELAVWGRNITDKDYYVYNGFVSDALHAQPAMPATYGISLKFEY